jgi:hypothetical protein
MQGASNHSNEALALQSLAAELTERGQPCSSHGLSVPCPALALEFRAREAKALPYNDQCSFSVVFEARAVDADSDGILVLSIGFGASQEAAARSAADQWVTGVYPVLRSYLAKPGHRCDVEKSHMIVAVEGSDKRYGWTIHVGPLIARLYGGAGSIGELGHSEGLRAVFDALHPFSAHAHMFWIELFAARYPDGKVDATCRYNNKDLPEGQESLLIWAGRWPETNGSILTKRQFLLFQPTEIADLPSGGRLERELERHLTKEPQSWWRRLVRGG